jgi:hypothetical protein
MPPFRFLVALALLCALPSRSAAGDWQEVTGKTAEGDTLIIGKKGRAEYSMRIEAATKADSINCIGFHRLLRAPLALDLRTAGERAAASTQVGSVLSYSDSLAHLTSDKDVAAMSAFGAPICALGIDAFPGVVTLTLGTAYKPQGRTATITGVQATKLAGWLLKE